MLNVRRSAELRCWAEGNGFGDVWNAEVPILPKGLRGPVVITEANAVSGALDRRRNEDVDL